MFTSRLSVGQFSVLSYTVNTAVIGSGAAGLNAAVRLADYGQSDIALVTEGMGLGTSRNTGSDKQTYFRLMQAGDTPDSVEQMTKALMDGGSMDGDIALCEAALSAQCFYHLVELGVKFPCSRYGEFVSYKTDHDVCSRGTSCGPYTSRDMTLALEKAVKEREIPILDNLQCIRILRGGDACRGVLCIKKGRVPPEERYVVIRCKNVIFATGGPAGMYSDSVYPLGHFGATGLALEAGVKGKNLTEWQFGLSSVRPRWNVSGTYMQAVPKFISTKQDGTDAREFLWDYLDEYQIWENVFLKGYQWPFDVRKIADGSSIIDILVYIETKEKGRRVFLDYRENPHNCMPRYEDIPSCCRSYLESAHALLPSPVERLKCINQPAFDFYLQHNIDLTREMLEISLCVQHNNGGLSTDMWWETNLQGFFAVGEASGTHGVYRPGGSALNAGQVGSMRAAQYIARCRRGGALDEESFLEECKEQIIERIKMGEEAMGTNDTVYRMLQTAAERMSKSASIIRDAVSLDACRKEVADELAGFSSIARVASTEKLPVLYRLHELLLCQYVYLSAMIDYAHNAGRSRGSAIYHNPSGCIDRPFLTEQFRHILDNGKLDGYIQEIQYKPPFSCETEWRPVRPLPNQSEAFETVWKHYREDGNVF